MVRSATQRRAVLSRFEPGASLPTHRHAGDEILYVIEGAIADESGTVSAGNMGYRPNGCVHNVSSKNGATVLAVVTGGVEPAKELGGAPRSLIFALSEVPWRDTLPGVRQKLIWEDKATNRRAVLALFEPGASCRAIATPARNCSTWSRARTPTKAAKSRPAT